jgi:diguanylate cyclase (GGDEF)-like protein
MKKGQAALLCVGINRIDHIIQLYGEEAADDVIAGVGKILQKLTRDCDLIGRYHRDDFLILARCTLQQGEMIATRLREAVQKEIFISGGKPIKTAVSIGITAHPEHGRTLGDLFSGAYRALEVLRGWNTTACLVYDAAQHAKKAEHEPRR